MNDGIEPEESNDQTVPKDKKGKVRKQPQTRISFNQAVSVVNYNKFNKHLLSPEENPKEEGDNRISALKTAKKSFKKIPKV